MLSMELRETKLRSLMRIEQNISQITLYYNYLLVQRPMLENTMHVYDVYKLTNTDNQNINKGHTCRTMFCMGTVPDL